MIQGVLCDPDECYIGTECWSAQEAFVGGVITHKTDIFAFGLVLWYVVFLYK